MEEAYMDGEQWFWYSRLNHCDEKVTNAYYDVMTLLGPWGFEMQGVFENATQRMHGKNVVRSCPAAYRRLFDLDEKSRILSILTGVARFYNELESEEDGLARANLLAFKVGD